MRQVRQKLLHFVKPCQELLKFGQGAGQREAYLALGDVLVAFGRQLQQAGQLGPLVYTADTSLQQTLQVSGMALLLTAYEALRRMTLCLAMNKHQY